MVLQWGSMGSIWSHLGHQTSAHPESSFRPGAGVLSGAEAMIKSLGEGAADSLEMPRDELKQTL